MAAGGDPFYNRKPVPDELIQDVGYTGLDKAAESQVRERKLSVQGGDLRKFSNPKSKDGKLDPYYQRKPVSLAEIDGVGETGLTPEEEYLSRERKLSRNGDDLRKFSTSSSKKGWHPTDDPYYGRKPVNPAQTVGVGELDMTPAEAFEVRERKASMFDLSGDPFQQVTGSGHRASISAGPGLAMATDFQRRRSSAVAPHHNHEEHQHHSGYAGDTKLAPIESRTEQPPATETGVTNPTNTHTTTTTTTTTSTHLDGNTGTANAGNVATSDGVGHTTGEAGHTTFYNAATRDLDNIAPHEQR